MNGTLAVNGTITKTQYNPGEIIEELTTVCNGRPVTVLSGTYTPTNVTAAQTSTSTHTEINGSNITYNKPVGAKRIYYKFACQWDDNSRGAITHFKIRVYHNGAWRDINPSRYTHATQYLNDGNITASWVVNEYIFECDADAESQHDGRFLSSKTSYTFDVTWRQHGASDYNRLHLNEWWDGRDRYNTPAPTNNTRYRIKISSKVDCFHFVRKTSHIVDMSMRVMRTYVFKRGQRTSPSIR